MLADVWQNSLDIGHCPPMADLCSFRIVSSFSSCSTDRATETITSNVESLPRKAYFKCEGSGFSSNFGGSSIDGFVGFVPVRSKVSFGYLPKLYT